jgi:cytochrome c peroxidase
MKFIKISLCAVFMVAISSCSDDNYVPVPNETDNELLELLNLASNGEGTSFFTLPSETDYAAIPQDPLNPITAEKVALGKLLVHETATGGDPKMEVNRYTYACASCHPVASGFFSGLRQGIGEGGMGFGLKGEGRVVMPSAIMPLDSVDALPIKPPSIVNVAYQEVALWNGALGGTGINLPYVAQNADELPDNLLGYEGLEVQGMTGQLAHRLKIDEAFATEFGYTEMFDAAFPNVPVNERYSRITGGLAIAAFNRTVLTNRAPWQEWLRGDFDALTQDQKEGAVLFFSKGLCYECHTGPALKSMEFYAWGMKDLVGVNTGISSFGMNTRTGRASFTNRPEDDFKFKVPTLYNLKDNAFYGHGGSFNSIRDVIVYKNNGIKENAAVPDTQLASQFGSTQLSAEEIDLITDFIKNALYDPDLVRYAPEAVLSGNCIPNNDPQSREDLGCE